MRLCCMPRYMFVYLAAGVPADSRRMCVSRQQPHLAHAVAAGTRLSASPISPGPAGPVLPHSHPRSWIYLRPSRFMSMRHVHQLVCRSTQSAVFLAAALLLPGCAAMKPSIDDVAREKAQRAAAQDVPSL